ncbi:hypothetical protein IQ07DRAFT_645530 [Pyrenochaeta sp. DS3sAY3a]|nr:hypothetical protein IQ07DRAFT_645530 [Pyrenochaeta sp. DS3sAY3a]
MYLQANGFAGHDVCVDENDQLKDYMYWAHFNVKQTFESLRPKEVFVPHISARQGGHKTEDHDLDTLVHGPHSIQNGWEWYEMGFFAHWNPAGSITLLCFDVPAKAQKAIEKLFLSGITKLDSPYAAFTLISDELLRLYDSSVWRIRNHISQWETRRSQETDYFLLHEIARHGVHVNETLSVAARSLGALRQYHDVFLKNLSHGGNKPKIKTWDTVGSRLRFQLDLLQNLNERSVANNARIQNEITLAFNAAAQRDSMIQVEMGLQSTREASAMRAIAVVTMIFLPATFVSTLFGMNFFSFEPSEGRGRSSFTVSTHFWIYWVITIPLTIITLLMWLWWNATTGRLQASRFKMVTNAKIYPV